jgi:hypothetical protein
VSYVIAAYGLVVVSLLAYGLRIQAQRRASLRAASDPVARRKT